MTNLKTMRQWAVLAAVLAASASFAGNPLFPYQGRLDKNGAPQSGTFDFRFSLWTTAAAGTQLWTADLLSVPVVNGNFAVKLGSTTPIPDTLLAQSGLFLDVQVKGPGDSAFRQLAGRQQWLHVPYAATSSGDFRVNGQLTVGVAPDGGAAVSSGPSENVAGTLRVSTPGGSALDVTSQSLNSSAPLTLQPGGGAAIVGGNLTVNGTFTAPNTWTKIYDSYQNFSGTGLTVGSLDGSRQRVYKIFYTGWLSPLGVDTRLLLRINGATTGYRSYISTDGDQAFSEWDTTGFHLGRTTSVRPGDLSGEVTLYASADTNRIAIRGNDLMVDYSVNTIFGARIGGVYTTFANTTSLTFVPVGGSGTYNGRITIYALAP